jgi:hypothetical protein
VQAAVDWDELTASWDSVSSGDVLDLRVGESVLIATASAKPGVRLRQVSQSANSDTRPRPTTAACPESQHAPLPLMRMRVRMRMVICIVAS